MTQDIRLVPVPGIPLVAPGDDLCGIILQALEDAGEAFRPRDVVVVAQKVVSKAEGRFVDLASVTPSPRARKLARRVAKDPRFVELVLGESKSVLRHRPGLLIVVHRLGFVLANAGIDASNVDRAEGRVLLLPEDPDASAGRLRAKFEERRGVDVGVVVSDSLGRAWRRGTVGVAIGAAGLPALLDLRGRGDLFGRPLISTHVGLADEIAAAASLLQGQADERTPVAIVRGLRLTGPATDAGELIRPEGEDLFR